MGNDDANPKTPPPRDRNITTSGLLNDPLKGQPTGRLPRIADKLQVDELFKILRPRFAPKAVMLLVASETEQITVEGRLALKEGFQEFKRTGGDKLVLVVKSTTVASVIKQQARSVGLLDIVSADTTKEGGKISGAYWDLHHPPPVPSK